ncbi:hypothetical protein AB0J14_38370 [Micromonospora arborensis]|uniref:hypothetical protein n=1 Tax=Micromonospora arborensis TaxID=2116518 RepID=UPI0033D426DA
MTRAPANLMAVRSLLLTHLDNSPGANDLDSNEVGIVPDSAHRGGYHCGSDRVLTGDYSVVESPRDRGGLTLDAAALDVGGFEVSVGGKRHTLASFSVWLVAQCAAKTADTRDIREVIYSPDGTTVKRWDRLGKRSSGDSSHRWHTHISYHRDAIRAGRDQTAVMRRYLQSIGLIKAPTVEADVALDTKTPIYKDGPSERQAVADLHYAQFKGNPGSSVEQQALARIEVQLAALAGRDVVDEPAIVAGVLAGLTPERIAAAIPEALTEQVADALAKRLQG